MKKTGGQDRSSHMKLTHRLARPMLASMFVVGGADAISHPQSKVKAADAVVGPLQRVFPALPDDPEVFVKANGTAQVVGGSLLALGWWKRLAALMLIGSIVPTTYAGHRFWLEVDDAKRSQQRIHFLKNLGLLGGLLLALDADAPPVRRRSSMS